MELGLLLGTALFLGVLHSIEPDHLAAVSSFVVRRPGRRAAIGYGLRWSVGHGGVIILAGVAIVLLRMNVDPAVGHWLERLVGVSLILLGGWVLATARTLHAHFHRHDDGVAHVHLHAHPLTPPEAHPRPSAHRHRHAATAVGALHGLAGTAPAVALIPLVRADSVAVAGAYLLVFAVGTAAAMVLYAMFAGIVADRAASRSEKLARGLARVAGLGTIAVGFVWILG